MTPCSTDKSPLVSIVMATYNRADTIERAIRSVQTQSLSDWELIIVNDGSTDDTAAVLETLLEERIKIIHQENGGFVNARNTGLSASTGKYIAFLDSDDEWLSFHLELCVNFLEAHPEEQFVAAELTEDFGHGRTVNHYRVETSEWYPRMARQIRSKGFDRQAEIKDDYLRVYESREPIGEWGAEVLRRAGHTREEFIYHGNIFEKLRWGYLIAVNSLVVKRSALVTVGLEQPEYNIAADYHYIGLLCKNFRANFIGLPTYIKHELTKDGDLPRSDHIATGKTAFVCAQDTLRAFDNLFWESRQNDPELCALRALKILAVAKMALAHGERGAALDYLRELREGGFGVKALALELFAKTMPTAELTRVGYEALAKSAYACEQLMDGEVSLFELLRKTLSIVVSILGS
jgi:glycosyltransferase involved in cell wall biosynthesis